jgi:hypothetical protein
VVHRSRRTRRVSRWGQAFQWLVAVVAGRFRRLERHFAVSAFFHFAFSFAPTGALRR